MTLKMRYEGKNVWGHKQWREDWCSNATAEELNTAFRELRKNPISSIVDVNRSIIVRWDTIADYEQNIVTERRYANQHSYDDERKPLQQVKREWRNRLNREMKGGENA